MQTLTSTQIDELVQDYFAGLLTRAEVLTRMGTPRRYNELTPAQDQALIDWLDYVSAFGAADERSQREWRRVQHAIAVQL